LTPVDYDPFADAEISAVLPLTEPQREMWTAAQMGDDASCAYNLCYALVLRGPLSQESMQRALQQVVDRHDALRVTIDANGERQKISPSSQIALPLTDLSQQSPQLHAEEIARTLQEEATRPFDLAAGPLLRARLIREVADLHRLIVTVHHIVCDGWSSAVLFGDLGRIYAADRHGLRPQLPTAAPYRDYVAHEAARLEDAPARADEEYWAQQYADCVPVLDLPLDRPRPAVKTYQGACRELRLDKSLCRTLKAVGAKHGCTLFVTLLASFEALLSRLSGQDDFAVGVPMAGHALLDNGHLVGHCVNMIPLRCRIAPAVRFVDHLKHTRHAFLEAQPHQQFTFSSLLRRLNVPRDPGRTPLVSVTFNIDKIGAPFDFGELTLDAVESPPKHFVNFELSVNVVDNGRDLLLECEYNTDLFAAATIDRWLSHYRVLLEAIASDPGQRLDELPLLTEGERHHLLVEWNDTSTDHPADALLHELFEAQAARTPEGTAVAFEDRLLTYRELDTRANQLAHCLQGHGVGPDTLVPLCVERSLEMVIGILGILKAGGAYVPIDPDYPPQRIAWMLDEIDSPVVLTHQRLDARITLDRACIIHLDSDWPAIARESVAPVSNSVAAANLAYIIYTSGSTGRPKGVMIPHAGICNHMLWMQRVYPLQEADVVLQKTPFGFDASVWEFFAPLLAGAKLVMAQPEGHLDPAYLAKTILAHGVSILQLVPSQLRMLLDEPAFWHCAPPLKHVYCGGEPLTRELCDAFYARLPQATLRNLYGPTETSIDATSWTCPHAAHPGAIPVGRPIDNVRAYIVNPRMQLSPIGVPGELLIGGIGLARGYLNHTDLTAEKFVPDLFHAAAGARLYKTGDLARLLPDGNIELLGRIDSQVKLRGFRIELGEIETCIARHSAIRTVAVIAREDIPGDKRLVAYLVADDPPADLIDQLRALIRASLPAYMIPAHFVMLEAMPLDHHGKLDRKGLPVPGTGAQTPRGVAVAPRTPSETLVAGMFRDVLGRADLGVHDNFFDLGGDSLMAARLMSRLRAASGTDLPLRNLFERPTAAQLAEAIDALSWSSQSSAPAGDAGNREQIEL
jgi:amino acid adenylation domain-containing protein